MPQPILLNDILRLPTRDHAGIKAKFNKRNKNVDPIDSYLADPKTAIDDWLNWRGKRGDFAVGQTALQFMRLKDGCYLLVAVRKVIADTGIPQSHAYTTEDIRAYLAVFQRKHKSSKVTIDNIRRIFSSFFAWLEEEDYIIKSPVRRIHKVKTGMQVKEVLTDENLEHLRDNCKKIRDLAIIDLLASTGMRVGELVKLNREDINFNERECLVFGKGNKERIVYFNARAKIHLQQYLATRKDRNKALFVSLAKPHNRLEISGVETRLRKIGREAKIPRVHPHKFRRTLATMAIDKGMPVEQMQRLLGHVKIDTTMHYAMVNQTNVKLSHRKFIG